MNEEKVFNVLFLCTGNSARSVIAESIMNRLGGGQFHGFSAGSMPLGQVNPLALGLLRSLDYPVDDLRSKSWDEFATSAAPVMDFVFTVCDNAAGELCPVWPGQPMTAHWGIPDPAAATGSDAEKHFAFAEAHRMLTNRISVFVNLPLRSLTKLSLQEKLRTIGKSPPDRILGKISGRTSGAV